MRSNLKIFSIATAISLSVHLFSTVASAKVYRDIQVGNYKSSIQLSDFKGITFLQFMKTVAFPAINAQADKQKAYDHITGVQRGEGVEIKLSENVSTYHVKYAAHGTAQAERSGRSFSAVGFKSSYEDTLPMVTYVADASYKHYLTTLGKLVKTDEKTVRDFYTAAVKIVANSDSSGVEALSEPAKEVLADFVAVYVAEQYRHMMSGSINEDGTGNLGRNHNWDDAHLQVTLLGAFHGAQSEHGMFFEGRYTTRVYNQLNNVGATKYCVYKRQFEPAREQLKKRRANLTDYWQFNKECARSGVNLTRQDFTAMGRAITTRLALNDSTALTRMLAALGIQETRNAIDEIAEFFIDQEAAPSLEENTNEVVESIVEFLMESRRQAVTISTQLTEENEI